MKRLIFFVAAPVLLMAGACAAPKQESIAGEGRTVIHDVVLIDIAGETIRPGVDLLIEDRTIVAVGPGLVDQNPAANLIEGQGRFVIPALYDSHIHIDTDERVELMLPEAEGLEFGMEELEEDLGVYPLHGITTVVALDGSPDQLELKRIANSGDWTLPRVRLASPILDGAESGNPLHVKINSPAEAEQLVQEYAARDYDLIKVYTFLDRESYLAILEQADAAGLPVWGHLPKDLELEEALDTRLTTVAHAEELTRLWDGEDPEFAAKVAALLVERGISLIPNLVAYDQIISEIDDLDSLLASKDWEMVTPLARIYSVVPYNGYVEDFGKPEIRDKVLAYFRKQHGMMFEIVRQVEAAGGTLLAGSDAGNPTMYPGDGLHRELELLVAAGLSPYRALAAATLGPAAILAESDTRGSIARGRVAEIVFLDADPIADIRNSRTVSSLFTKGEYVDREMLGSQRQRLAASFDKREARYKRHLPGN
jgi:imidazolonepropionase-like amidohydrolase